MVKSELELQLDSSTPENFKLNESINTLLSLYTDSFDELQSLLENPLNILDTDFLIKRFEETRNENFDTVRKELFRIHLQEIFKTFEDIEESEEIYNKFKSVYEALGVSTEDLKIVADIDKSINSEYINASTSYKTKKGTRAGFFFVYDIINKAGIQSINADGFFNLIEGTRENPDTPYEYSVETSLYKEVFDRTITPLAHPVGFNWNFIRLLFLTLSDYFGIEEIKHMQDTTLTCYGINESTITQKEIIESEIFGSLKSFAASEDQDGNEKIIIDYNPLDGTDGNGLRLTREYNGGITLYDRQSVKILHNTDNNEYVGQIQYLEIDEVRLVDIRNGLLSVNMVDRVLLDEEFEAIESIDFKEYSIIDKPTVKIEYRLKDDKPDTWYTSILLLENKIVDQDEIKYFLPQNFTRQDILDGTNNYNGRIVEDFGLNCQIHYKATYTYKIITKDISGYVEGQRPIALTLPKSTDEVVVTPDELAYAVNNGLDPYKGIYSTLDHTVEEINWYDGIELWARLDPGSKRPQPLIGQTNLDPIINSGHLAPEIKIDPETNEVTYIPDGQIIDLVIGGDWLITDNSLHIFDIGYNSNSVPNRWEQYYKPTATEDLAIINSTNSVARYERDNTEFVDVPFSNNDQYTAWEDFNMDIYITMFKNQEYCFDTLEGSWNIGDDNEYIGCLFIDGSANSGELDAEIYRNQWNFREDSEFYQKYDNMSFNYNYGIEDIHNLIEHTNENYYEIHNIEIKPEIYGRIDQETNIGEFDINGTNLANLGPMFIGYEVKFSEEYSIDEEILMTPLVTYQYNTFAQPLYIGEFNIGVYDYINSIGYGKEVEAEIYRAEWNYPDDNINSKSFEIYLSTDLKVFVDSYILETSDYLDEDNEYKPATDSTSIVSNAKVEDDYEYLGYGERLISDTTGVFFEIGSVYPEEVRIGNIHPITEDDWSFGVYRYDDAQLNWVLIEDNNISNAA